MALMLEGSSEGFSESVNLFQVPPTDTSVESIMFKTFNPISQISKNSNIEFYFSGNTNLYVDFKRSTLMVKARILTGEGNPVKEEPVGFCKFSPTIIIQASRCWIKSEDNFA